jgi:hypothetical protein
MTIFFFWLMAVTGFLNLAFGCPFVQHSHSHFRKGPRLACYIFSANIVINVLGVKYSYIARRYFWYDCLNISTKNCTTFWTGYLNLPSKFKQSQPTIRANGYWHTQLNWTKWKPGLYERVAWYRPVSQFRPPSSSCPLVVQLADFKWKLFFPGSWLHCDSV